MVASRSVVSTAELRRRHADPDLTIVDVRPLPAYNGWRLTGESRGGHIPGAVSFPAAWLESVDEVEVERLLHEKNIVPGRQVVLSGNQADAVTVFRSRLDELGHTDVRVHERGWPEWADDPALPVERLPNYERLVHPDWLSQLLAGQSPEAAPAGRFLLFHVNFGVPEEYEENHLPEALYLDTNLLENPVDWNRRAPEELKAALQLLGITQDTTSSSTAGTPRETPTRSGPGGGPGRSRHRARHSSCTTAV